MGFATFEEYVQHRINEDNETMRLAIENYAKKYQPIEKNEKEENNAE